MPFWVYIITNPIILFVYFLLFEIGYKIITVIKHKRWGVNFKWRVAVYIVLLIISTIMNHRILFTKDYNKSLVDATPIADLSREQIESLENKLVLFNDYSFITKCEINERDDHTDLYKTCNIVWIGGKEFGSLDIIIWFYRDEKKADDSVRFWTEGRRTYIKNPNHSEVYLLDSYMSRSHGVPVAYRELKSLIRFDNVIIRMHESPKQHLLDKNLTSDFIKLLCDILVSSGY